MRRRPKLLLTVALFAGVAAAGPAPAALAATFTANSTVDEPDKNLDDGLCLAVTGNCTLRAAIQQANALGGGAHRIVLLGGATYALTRAGAEEEAAATGDLDISSNLTIDVTNDSAVVDGSGDRVFDVRPGGVLEVRRVYIRFGAGVLYGGGIYNAGTLTLRESAVLLNRAEIAGGGINSVGTVTLLNSFVFNNVAPVGGGIDNLGTLALLDSSVFNNGGEDAAGILNGLRATLTLTRSTVKENSAARNGGGIVNHGRATLTNSTISGNHADDGGGIFSTAQTLTVTNTTISENSASRAGGGIYVRQLADFPPATVTLMNSTISTNTAKGDGGAIWNTGVITATNVTIAKNVADSNANGTGNGGGVFNPSGGTVAVANTLIGANVDPTSTSSFPDCVGSLTSQGFNLIQNTFGCTIGGDTTGNIIGREPLLGPLQDNGGTTFTHALISTSARLGGFTIQSPAIDFGSPGSASSCSRGDQRGASRPVDGNADGVARCDIGAYEAAAPLIPLGTFAIGTASATARRGERLTYTLTWTVPPPRGWRSLRTLELVFLDDEGTALWVRFEEVAGAPGLFRLVNPKNGNAGPSFAPGSPSRLESELATVHLAESAMDGPPGAKVTLTLTVSFKPHAAGRVYDVLVAATDDTGDVQGFHRAGTVAVTG